MSTLLIDELFAGVVVSQDVRVYNNQSIAFIRPWIYKQGTIATGQLRCDVYDGATLLKRVDIDHALINTEIPSAYAHGYIRFDLAPLPLNVYEGDTYHTYTFKFSMAGYTNDSNNYIAICRDWEFPKYVIYDGPIANDSVAPYGIELFNYRK